MSKSNNVFLMDWRMKRRPLEFNCLPIQNSRANERAYVSVLEEVLYLEQIVAMPLIFVAQKGSDNG